MILTESSGINLLCQKMMPVPVQSLLVALVRRQRHIHLLEQDRYRNVLKGFTYATGLTLLPMEENSFYGLSIGLLLAVVSAVISPVGQ